jgi:1,4-dihydroxy-2-naphthoyl-CoA hydrolase
MINQNITIQDINLINQETMVSNLGIEFTEIGDDFLIAKMPVDERTFQPMGLLHGGANVALAETLGSVGTFSIIDGKTHYGVCIEINANHIGSAMEGFVFGTAKLVHQGRTTHIWNIEITDEKHKLISTSRMTMMIIERKK